MAGDNDLLARADDLMLRHRVFVAGARAAERDAATGADIPVLTDVVPPGEAASASEIALPPDRVEALARELMFERLPHQRQALADELVAWLDAELPQVVMRAMDGVVDHLIGQITGEVRAALLPRLQAALEADQSAAPVASNDAG